MQRLRRALAEAGVNVLMLEATVKRLCEGAYVVAEWRNSRRDREQWELRRVEIDPRAQLSVDAFLGIQDRARHAEEIRRWVASLDAGPLSAAGPEWADGDPGEADHHLTRRRLENWFHQLLGRIAAGEEPPLTALRAADDVLQFADVRYLPVLRTIHQLLANPGSVSERLLSQEVFGDSKELGRYRGILERLAGGDLLRLGIERHSHLVYMAGPLDIETRDGVVPLGSLRPFVALPEEIVKSATIRTEAERLVLVENQTCFEEIARRGLPEVWQAVVLFGRGFLPGPERSVVRQLAALPGMREIWGWFDPDPAGLFIFADVARLIKETGTRVRVRPLLMDVEVVRGCAGGTELTAWDRNQLERLAEMGLPPALEELRVYLLRSGCKVEQEEVLRTTDDRSLAGVLQSSAAH